MDANTPAVPLPSLYELFMGLSDPREPQGLRHSLAAMLTLASTAILSGAKTLTDIAPFGRRRKKLLKAMDFTHKKSPCISTFHYLFKELDAAVFEATLMEWLLAHHGHTLKPELHLDGKVVSIDGIKLRELDFVDVGGLLEPAGVVPVVIKSLLFPS